jgi:hypothetical protein
VTTFVVRPNQLAREKPYIRHNIDATRKAFGLDKIEELPFEPRTNEHDIRPASHCVHARQYAALGLASVAGYASPDSGDSHVLRLS